MRKAFLVLLFLSAGTALAQRDPNNPTWWDKYQFLAKGGADAAAGPTISVASPGGNVDVSNECGPQSETFIAINTKSTKNLAAGSNEIFRDPMRGYSSFDEGKTWAGVDLPLPPPKGNGTDFGSDPGVAFDAAGNLFYSYIVVFFGNGNGNDVNGTEVAVAKSTDGGQTYPSVTFFSFEGGKNHFNDKPIITADVNASSPFKNNVYVAWDAATGGSISGGLRFGRSTDHGASFTVQRIDNPQGQGRLIAADPFVGPNGEVYVAWNDAGANTITLNRSFDGGATFGTPITVAHKTAVFDVGIPAESFRRALVYPACDADRSNGPHRGRLYCSWMDLRSDGTTDIFLSSSDDHGSTWSSPKSVGDTLAFKVDRFNQWLSVDATTGEVTVSFYDTRNDTTGSRFMTDTYLARSSNGGATFTNTRVSTESSNEHDCNGIFPCVGINYGNQQGDYEGLVTYSGIAHPIWTDSRNQLDPATGCRTNLLMEEVYTASVK